MLMVKMTILEMIIVPVTTFTPIREQALLTMIHQNHDRLTFTTK